MTNRTMIFLFLIKRLFLATVLIFFISDLAKAQGSADVDSLSNKAATYFDGAKEKKSLKTYLKVLEKDPEHFEALWRTSLLYARIGFRMESKEEKESYYNKALKYAEKAIELYPDKGYSNFAFAVAQGRISDISDVDTRIEKSHIIKKYIDKAVELIPDYAPAWLLLGTWHSEIANVDPAKELAAGIFSKGLPDGASNEKAEKYIKKAIELRPEKSIRFKLDLARHYNRSGQTQKAIEILNEVVKEKPNDEVEKWNLERAKEFHKELT